MKNDPQISNIIKNKTFYFVKKDKNLLQRKNQLIKKRYEKNDNANEIQNSNSNTNRDSDKNSNESDGKDILKAILNQSDLETEHKSCKTFILYSSRFECDALNGIGRMDGKTQIASFENLNSPLGLWHGKERDDKQRCHK